MTRLSTMTATLCLAATGALSQDTSGGTYSPFCQAAFTPGDTNQDGMIQPEEAVAIASGAYESLDANNDGSIDREELGTCIGDARAAFLPPDASSGSFAGLDTDASGKLERAEIAAAVDDMWSDIGSNDPAYMADFVNLETSSEAYEQMLRTREQTVASSEAPDAGPDTTAAPANEDADQPAETAEAAADTAEGAAAEPTAEPGAETTADAADTTAAELPDPARSEEYFPQATTGEALTLEELAQRTGQVYLLLDTDQDEAITEEEFLARAQEISTVVEQQIDTLFGSLDTDASGGISQDEFTAAAEARTTRAAQQAEAAGKLDPSGTLTITTYYILR